MFNLRRKKGEATLQETKLPSISFVDAPQEHQFAMVGLDVVISHSLKIVWVLDTSGSKDDTILLELEEHLSKIGYFLFHTSTVPEPSQPKPA
jgi:hypothetical protein